MPLESYLGLCNIIYTNTVDLRDVLLLMTADDRNNLNRLPHFCITVCSLGRIPANF